MLTSGVSRTTSSKIVVMTCRSQVYHGEFSDRVDRTLKGIEFTDVQMQRLLKA